MFLFRDSREHPKKKAWNSTSRSGGSSTPPIPLRSRANEDLQSNKRARFGQVPTLVYLHGNAGNIGFRLINAGDILRATQCNVLLVDYRG